MKSSYKIENNPYKTHWYNRRAAYWIDKHLDRDSGDMGQIEVIRLDPAPGVAPSEKPPVRIFLGTEPGQYRATRVFVWSVMQVRNPARQYEIHLMSNIAGIPRVSWKTGFTNYRYAIPHLAGNTGRAIYNDVDQIYLTDPAALFDMEMGGKGVLAISVKENSVMLIDCDRMAPMWTLDDVKAGKTHDHFKRAMEAGGLFGEMPGTWNSRDGEFPIAQTDCLHYTTLHTQPWKPFPSLLVYRDNPLGQVWHDLEKSADAAGYLLFTKERPSAEFHRLIAQYQQMHDAPEIFPGSQVRKYFAAIADLARETGATGILDYGAGKAINYQTIPGEPDDSPWRQSTALPGIRVRCYDPGHAPFAELDGDERHDGVISTDVVEHLSPFDVPWVIDEMFGLARKFVFIVAACYPAIKTLPDGRNAHTTQQQPYWWHTQMALAARRHPGLRWQLTCQQKGRLGRRQTIFTEASALPLD
ncbi:MAG: hypothetical protein U0942_10955 [Parvibaculum sp.]|uniref:hypothetical protein n=1 Tax=Parvibaculum sp. TaxID=2024848 RepID=UPI002ABBF60D|nr:hypothetical protein [Parvibaculum sp.]MDZ4381847.1 hypothetical protein [Parvibaculum sp.]